MSFLRSGCPQNLVWRAQGGGGETAGLGATGTVLGTRWLALICYMGVPWTRECLTSLWDEIRVLVAYGFIVEFILLRLVTRVFLVWQHEMSSMATAMVCEKLDMRTLLRSGGERGMTGFRGEVYERYGPLMRGLLLLFQKPVSD